MIGWIYVHNLNPVIFHLGPLAVGWYGTMYALSFLAGYALLLRASRKAGSPIGEQEVSPLLTYIILGVVVGGRLGWVMFYGGLPYFIEPWRMLETWKGGMSFHGGMLGVFFAMWLYARRRGIPVLAISDHCAPWVPVGLFFGRIGNFINGELYGMATNGSWGVVFPADPDRLPRHPSQLYEAGLEGALLFTVLALMRRRRWPPGTTTALFLMLYGLARFAVEFVRLPDRDIGYSWGWVTRGQLLSLPMVLAGLIWLIWLAVRQSPAATRGRAHEG
ncbi:MAG: prolipoprotein diacylglyceryl transferase [Candidatus Lambdaproteobacteria bacterium]|nr:prolipoprotein diacylglyceryl transferase [Candidatus Lambdaproteobacteria bacterium]